MKFGIITICSLLIMLPNLICAQSQPRRTPNFSISKNRNISPIRKKATKEQKKQLLPQAADIAAHSMFLAQPNTGIFRLFPDLGCEDNGLILKADEVCLNAIPESSFYSFREEEHTREILADIRLKNNYLVSDGILAQGVLVNLGDVGLENVSLASDGLDFLTSYEPQTTSREAQKQFLQMMRGVKSGKYEYRKALPAVENATYAMRVVAYKGNIYRTYRGFLYNLLEGDRRIDLTLAFRVVRKDADGSLTLLWKELERRESPKIKFPKKNENSPKR